jgi:DNA mismatch repair protein MutS2
MSQTLFDQATHALEWPRVLEFLALHAQSAIGRARCRSLSLASELVDARQRQQETSEMVAWLEASDPVPALGFPDICEPLSRASKGGVLDAGELRDCAVVLTIMAELERYAEFHKSETQRLAQVLEPLRATRALQGVLRAIEGAIQSDGAMKETASAE